MALFLVSYDIIEGNSYDAIIDELKRLGAVRTQRSTYFASVTTDSAPGFLQHLKKFVDPEDRLMVIKLTEKPAHTVGLKGTNAWLEEHFG
ncbi:CRISPR-associated endonuclease Cas2 [Stenotrophomonas forensis]|uniref:CRISPR-associated endoribonuclease Cas2 n=1 Tax=Stenotrophomonas forensis TaxID=2871169 RepID=A0ABY7Y5P6_9GAMM|nr:CRISPR-associated endonuclease Cas2 [Stenotrophomonas sp. DFS-20110405]WDM65294.1 CRISPR-associated endonuclease Cas2 [Stenotrophomonas sp. DFS-20110405]HDS1550627.1 CRISPR-associated endonuclease Cas2 [Stenotrophomonas maltophilia]